jgi:hypothetical protein
MTEEFIEPSDIQLLVALDFRANGRAIFTWFIGTRPLLITQSPLCQCIIGIHLI